MLDLFHTIYSKPTVQSPLIGDTHSLVYPNHDKLGTNILVSRRYTTLSRKLSLTGENNENTSSSPGRPSAEETSPGTDHALEMVGAGEELQEYTSGSGLMSWEETSSDQVMSSDAWIDSIGGDDWLNDLAPPISDPPTPTVFPAEKDAESPEATMYPESFCPQHKQQPGPVIKASSEASDTINASSTSQWMGSTQLSDQSDFFHIDTASSGWTDLNGNLLSIEQLQEDPLGLTKSSLEADDKTLISPIGSANAGQRGELVGKVSLVVDQCDRDALNYLLDVSRGLKGKAKLEIDT